MRKESINCCAVSSSTVCFVIKSMKDSNDTYPLSLGSTELHIASKAGSFAYQQKCTTTNNMKTINSEQPDKPTATHRISAQVILQTEKTGTELIFVQLARFVPVKMIEGGLEFLQLFL